MRGFGKSDDRVSQSERLPQVGFAPGVFLRWKTMWGLEFYPETCGAEKV